MPHRTSDTWLRDLGRDAIFGSSFRNDDAELTARALQREAKRSQREAAEEERHQARERQLELLRRHGLI